MGKKAEVFRYSIVVSCNYLSYIYKVNEAGTFPIVNLKNKGYGKFN